MVWDPRTSNGNETAKIRWRVAHYCRGAGLDVGCGPWKIFANAVGIDGMGYPGAGQNGPNLVMDCARLPIFGDRVFDFVYSSHLLEHIVDTEATLREWVRVLDVDGYLVLYLPHREFYPNMGQPGANSDHKHDFVPGDVVEVLRRIGGLELVVNEDRGAGDEYSFLLVARRLDERDAFVDSTVAASQGRPRAAIVRPGIYGDAIWASSVAYHLQRQGYHVTAYLEPRGEEVLRHDPNIDEIFVTDPAVVPAEMYGPFWEAEKRRYDRWVNLTESVETQLLVFPNQVAFEWPAKVRRDLCGRNYLEHVHRVAGIDGELQQRFYPTRGEREWARRQRASIDGPVVALAPSGSTWPKHWPWATELVTYLANVGVHVIILGDTRALKFENSPFIHVRNPAEWSIRQSMTFCVEAADAVVGQETGLLNAVALEACRKVVLLSHSGATQLTRDWVNTAAFAGEAACYPCHQVHHPDTRACTRDGTGKFAACQESISVGAVVRALDLQSLKAGAFRKAA